MAWVPPTTSAFTSPRSKTVPVVTTSASRRRSASKWGHLALDEDTDAGVGTHQPVDTGDVDMVGVLVGDEHGVEVVECVPGVAVHTGIDEQARRGGLHEHGGMPQATQLHIVEYATGPTRSGDRHYGFRALVTRSEEVA